MALSSVPRCVRGNNPAAYAAAQRGLPNNGTGVSRAGTLLLTLQYPPVFFP